MGAVRAARRTVRRHGAPYTVTWPAADEVFVPGEGQVTDPGTPPTAAVKAYLGPVLTRDLQGDTGSDAPVHTTVFIVMHSDLGRDLSRSATVTDAAGRVYRLAEVEALRYRGAVVAWLAMVRG